MGILRMLCRGTGMSDYLCKTSFSFLSFVSETLTRVTSFLYGILLFSSITYGPLSKQAFFRYKREDFLLSNNITLNSIEVGVLSKNVFSARICFIRCGWTEKKARRICCSRIGKTQLSHTGLEDVLELYIIFFRTATSSSTSGSTTTTLSTS